MAKQMTKAQVVDENIRLRAHCEVLERQLREARDELAATEMLGSQREYREMREEPIEARDYDNYYDYVRAAKRAQRGQKVVGYMSREQWEHRV